MRVAYYYTKDGETSVDHVTEVEFGHGVVITPPPGTRTDLRELRVLSGGVVEVRRGVFGILPDKITAVQGSSLPLTYMFRLSDRTIATIRLEDEATQDFYRRG